MDYQKKLIITNINYYKLFCENMLQYINKN